jgi:hypothetical protein
MTAAVDTTENMPRKKKPMELDGDKQLHRIARAGRQWKATIGRKVDMESTYALIACDIRHELTRSLAAYVYRLCLEWARLWADDRDAMSYKK